MYASRLFHRKGKKRSSSKRGARGEGSCCPIIKVKCKRKYEKIENAPPSLQARLKAFKAAKPAKARAEAAYKRAQAAFQRATGLSGTGPIHPGHEATSLPAREVAKAVNNPVMACTVSMGTKRYKNMTGAQAQAKVVELSKSLTAKRCQAVVHRG